MGIFEAVVQGIVQGITEFLPVSSSGHLLISQHILGVKENNLFFSVMLHIGTLIAVVAVYWKEFLNLISAFFSLIKKCFTRKLSFKDLNSLSFYEQMVIMIIIGLLPLFMLFIPIPGSGMNIKDIAEDLSSEKNIIIVGLALLFTSFIINKGIKVKKSFTFEDFGKKDAKDLDSGKAVEPLDALWIGIMQFIAAIFPGISRSGSTLAVGLLRRVGKKNALDYSFILGTPAIIAAALLELKEVLENGLTSSIDVVPVVVGVVVSAVVGFLSIKLFKWLLKTDKMMIFVIYTFVVGILTVIIGIVEKFKGVNIFTGMPI